MRRASVAALLAGVLVACQSPVHLQAERDRGAGLQRSLVAGPDHADELTETLVRWIDGEIVERDRRAGRVTVVRRAGEHDHGLTFSLWLAPRGEGTLATIVVRNQVSRGWFGHPTATELLDMLERASALLAASIPLPMLDPGDPERLER